MGIEASGLEPYIPRLAAEWEHDAPGALWREIEATCCFVDISGFTALSERLAKRGRIGAEELTEVLNHVFSRMLEVAYSKGGALLKFGGDALLLAFTGDDHPRMAAEGAVAMRAALREARTLPTSVGRVNLRMSVGVHSGVFHLFRVGDVHRELIITGPAASTTTRMEQTADAGEIVISPETADRLPSAAVGQAKENGRLLRWRRVVEGGRGPIPARPVPPAAVEGSVPIALRDRLTQRGGESEHRLASVAFVKFSGTDDLLASDGPDATAGALDTIVRSVQRAAELESVTFLASDIDANGGKIILTTGVPATQEDDEGRILRAVRMVMDEQHPLPVRVGVNRGHVFSGDIGTAYRRTFTVMGDTVNLAARLMAAANPGDIYATATILDQSRTQFATAALDPFSVKGKSEPVQAYRVNDATGSKSTSYGEFPLRGRDKELATLLHSYKSAEAGQGGSVVIDAERGAGKTRLVNEFVASAEPGQVLWLQGEAHSTGVPYQPLRPALRAVLGVDDKDRQAAGQQLLSTVSALAPELLPFVPLLAPLADAEITPTPQSAAVAEEFVRQRIADLVVGLLDAAAALPLLIVAEDAHWFDETTSEICTRLAAAARDRCWLICATRRSGLGGFELSEPETTLPLTLLSNDAALEIVEAATDTAPLRPHERDGIVARAGGNPLFLEELVRIVRDTSVESLPDTLDAVAMREIDSLPTTPRHVLRLASVLGRSFERSLLVQLLDSESVDAGTDPFEELTAQLVPEPMSRGSVRFRHALIQEAAYQSLPFRQRLVLHRKVGEAIERGASQAEDVAPLLSFHFLAAQDWERTWTYSRIAADVAKTAHAPGEEATHLERAVTASRRMNTVDSGALATVFSDLGLAFELLGEYNRAEDAYRHALKELHSDLRRRAQLAYHRAHLQGEYLGRQPSALRQLRIAKGWLTDDGPVVAGLRALLTAEESAVRLRQGRLVEGLARANDAVLQATQADDKRALARALDLQNTLLVLTGHQDEAIHLDEALELYEELGDGVHVASTLNNLGNTAFMGLRWNEATDFWARSAEASAAVGDLASSARAHVNLGDVRALQGRLDEAVALLGPARRTFESFGYRTMIAWTEMCLGRATAFRGELEAGIALERSALAQFIEIGAHMESLEACAHLAEVLVFGRMLAEAKDVLARAHEIERHVGESPLGPLVERVELTLAAASGDHISLFEELDGFLDRTRSLGANATYESLVVLALAERIGDTQRHAEILGLMDQLGIVSLPMLADTCA
jgi:class 3 adenylate cyclase/tetratricopeptide (TPR) repeat protein